MDKRKIEVNIFGQNYTILGDASPEYMNKLSSYVDSKMREITKQTSTISTTKVAILAALNLANEIFQLREENYKLENDLVKRSKNLIEIIDRGLEIEG
ncbi:MAG: hypothetical protein A2161_09060 [Candidatus Schekmanbacteria bacterium RBG_13_48_7]|uniref:Cell division protein ZapA n=1 Tax=Candidatus Schekmanbacteria bacterium RBG_13_48_7 TaxID=1817878 RepID=A0A1F7RNQ8_9BACT|nr:MAG: hypothetical protein A2161_09060 [Candidatus Schekmanbacteria bacterium RBG_13_48_7]